jgi:integrase
MLPGECRRDRVLTPEEETIYFAAARSSVMERHTDPTLLADVDTILIDCGLRPEECFRLQSRNIVGDVIQIFDGKTVNARRCIPITPQLRSIIYIRLEQARDNRWLFPARTKSGHIEKSTLRKPHATALKEATRLLREQTGSETVQFENFDLYTLRHTCLTRWAPHMDPWTLMRLAGHSDMATTKRYIHPEQESTRLAMQRARDAVDRRAEEALERARQCIQDARDRDKNQDTDLGGFWEADLNRRVK